MDSIIRRQGLGDILRRTAARLPHKAAIVCGDTTWTYGEFDAIATRVAAGFAARGVGVGTRVAVLSRNSHAFAAVRFALARLGAVIVPINFMLKPTEVAFILRHSQATRLCVDSEFATLAAEAAGQETAVEAMIWLPSAKLTVQPEGMTSFNDLASCADPLADAEFSASDMAQVIYTSGTESLPKGAMLTHESIITQYLTCLVTWKSRKPTASSTPCRCITAPSWTCTWVRRSIPAGTM
jgi:fatty-acyl-CoA synthase